MCSVTCVRRVKKNIQYKIYNRVGLHVCLSEGLYVWLSAGLSVSLPVAVCGFASVSVPGSFCVCGSVCCSV